MNVHDGKSMGNRESEGAMSCELTRHRPRVSPECRVSSQDGFSRGNPIDRTEFAVDVDIFTTLLCFFDLVNLWHWKSFSFQLLHGIGQNFKILELDSQIKSSVTFVKHLLKQ